MDPIVIRSNLTRSGATYSPPSDEDIASGEGLATSPPSGDPASDAGLTVPVYSHIPANTLQTCLADEGLATKPLPRGDRAPDALPQSRADPAPAADDYTTPISPELRTFLAAQTYIAPALHTFLYELGVTEIDEISYASQYQLPEVFPTCKFTKLQLAAAAPTGLSSRAHPALPVRLTCEVDDKPRHWAKQFADALKIVRDCPPLPKEGVFDPASLAWTLYHQSLKAIFDLVSDPKDPQAPRLLQALMHEIGLNPLPSLDSHPTAKEVMLTDSDSLLYRVLTKTLPDAFLQRVLGTDIFTSNSGLRLYYYLCNTSPHDRSQRLLTLRKTLYLQNGCKDKTKLASVLQMWYSMYKELLEDVNAASLDTVQLLTALKTLVAPQMNEELRGLTLAQHLANELAVIRRMLRVAHQPMRDLTLEEYFEVCREFAIELQSTTAHHNHAKSFQSLLGHDDESESAHCNMAQGKGGRGTGGKGGGKGGKGGGKAGHGPATITLGDKRICAIHVLGNKQCNPDCAKLDHSPAYKGNLTPEMLAPGAWQECQASKQGKCSWGLTCK